VLPEILGWIAAERPALPATNGYHRLTAPPIEAQLHPTGNGNGNGRGNGNGNGNGSQDARHPEVWTLKK
jgi:hypothetical protein